MAIPGWMWAVNNGDGSDIILKRMLCDRQDSRECFYWTSRALLTRGGNIRLAQIDRANIFLILEGRKQLIDLALQRYECVSGGPK